MSVYKKDSYMKRANAVADLAKLHASTIQLSNETLGFNSHSHETCDACCKYGEYFRSQVKTLLKNEAIPC